MEKEGFTIGRKPHIWFPGATYHIMSRGNRKLTIFHEDSDYRMFFRLLIEAKEKYPFTLHSYCLMSNHFHLQLQTIDTDVSKIMSFLLRSYSACYNSKYEYIGHVFQGRYKGLLIADDSYFLQTSRYIHLNPVKAGIVSAPDLYAYSSYPFYALNRNHPLISKNLTMDYFQNDIKRYRDFVERSEQSEIEEQIRKELSET